MDRMLQKIRLKAADWEKEVPRRIRAIDYTASTATVSAIILWVAPDKEGMLEYMDERISYDECAQRLNKEEQLDVADRALFPCLLACHTPELRFAYLCMNDEACLLFSNQTEIQRRTTSVKKFTLAEYMKGAPSAPPDGMRRLSLEQLKSALTDLHDACGNPDADDIMEHVVGIRFRGAHTPDDFWVRIVPVTA